MVDDTITDCIETVADGIGLSLYKLPVALVIGGGETKLITLLDLRLPDLTCEVVGKGCMLFRSQQCSEYNQ